MGTFSILLLREGWSVLASRPSGEMQCAKTQGHTQLGASVASGSAEASAAPGLAMPTSFALCAGFIPFLVLSLLNSFRLSHVPHYLYVCMYVGR